MEAFHFKTHTHIYMQIDTSQDLNEMLVFFSRMQLVCWVYMSCADDSSGKYSISDLTFSSCWLFFFFLPPAPAGKKGRHRHNAAHDRRQSVGTLRRHSCGWHSFWLEQRPRREVFLRVGQRFPSYLAQMWACTCHTFTLNVGNQSSLYSGQVIKAWDIGVATMRVGELCQLICKPEYAYGSAGSPPKIPPNATLIFEVSVGDILDWW